MDHVVLKKAGEAVVGGADAEGQVGLPARQSLPAFRPTHRGEVEPHRLVDVVVLFAGAVVLGETVQRQAGGEGPFLVRVGDGAPVDARGRCFRPGRGGEEGEAEAYDESATDRHGQFSQKQHRETA